MDLVRGALDSLIFKLGKLLKNEYKLLKRVPEQIESLIKELECADAALRKIGQVPSAELDEQVKLWAREIREASYDMEDVLHTFLVSEGGHETSDQESLLKCLLDKACGLVTMVRSQFKRRKIVGTINDINKRINEVTQRYGRYTTDSITVAKPAATVDPRLASMYKEVSQLIGIDKSSSELISMLSPQGDKKSEKEMKMVSIVGVGGLGKTTLAKAVYDKLKEGVDGHMVSAFVPVGRDPDLKKIFRDILIGLDKKKYMDTKMTILDERQLINELRDFLRDQRYLVVIDDIWDACSWETIKLAFVENNNGSRLITTTRHLDVAKKVGEVYMLQPLPSDKSKKLFYTRLFGAEGECFGNQPDEVSEKLLKKCNGIPLAIITMASLLAGKPREDWIEVCSSIAFCDKDNKQASDTEWILSLSYYDMPSYLKTCLLYLSAFPEDYYIDKDSLIWKWVAEGFVHCKPGARMFEVGEGYFNDLINRSMIMAVDLKNDGMVHGCHVHDMVLDLLRVKSQEENFVTICGTNAEGTSPSRIRRLALQKRTVEQIHQYTQMDLQHMRTFIACSCIVYPGISFLSFKLLRVLILQDCGDWTSKPPIHLMHLESLHHLRYLGVRRTRIRELPKEIGSLKYLQTLDLEQNSLTELPYSVGLLTQLICLNAAGTKVQNGVINKLTSLEELRIRVDDTTGQFVKDLGKLRELRVLAVEFDSDVVESDLLESVGNLHKIRHLQLIISGSLGGISRQAPQDQASTTNRKWQPLHKIWHLQLTTNDLWNTAVLPRPLQYLCARHTRFYTLPLCIKPSVLTNLSYLALSLTALDEEGLKILAGLPKLRYLWLQTYSTVTLSVHATDDCFEQLTYFMVPNSMPQYVLNEDSRVSFTLWNGEDDMAFGSKRRDKSIVAPAIMRNLEVLYFNVNVQALVHNGGSCASLGLEYLPSLQKVSIDFRWGRAFADDVIKEEAALTHAIEAHPNRPTFEINCMDKYYSTKRRRVDQEQEGVDSSTAYILSLDNCSSDEVSSKLNSA